jgi:hypothetical protein
VAIVLLYQHPTPGEFSIDAGLSSRRLRKIDLVLAMIKGLGQAQETKWLIGTVAAIAGHPPDAGRVDLGLLTISSRT